ncbi:GNAT family N-acetyltransferase [Arthrobacter rhizosphaerae]|uniref:GNAT family N-acetyltransferase n=1 Tax=Arthrobacter rhizosphaerae TaxID=2855490 RepID=UPI001FF6CF36|nr:GNAT family N-acetyltransferase [Arthrobacter rhizosphaerae]
MGEKYEVRRFRVAEKDSPDYSRSTDWMRAVEDGFYDNRRSAEFVDKIFSMYRSDDRELTGVYQTGSVLPHSLAADIPVATFGSLLKTLNTGYGRQLDTRLVTAVTVRGTHRRRGLLRQMMTEDLASAKTQGQVMAALTASEGSIYRRFGYGVATFERSIKVDTGPRFQLRHEPAGTVEIADRKVLLEVAPRVFAQSHQATPGSIMRQESYRQRVSGAFGQDGSEDQGIRCALHYNSDGEVDGYVSYKFAGWEAKPYTVNIVDLVAGSDAAYLDLWKFLGAIDLVERISWEEAPVDDPLGWALEDPRCIESSDHRDMLWLRILDVAGALTARRYSADGTLVFEVSDTLGFASGTYRLEVRDGEASLTNAGEDQSPELTLDVAELGSIYLGAVCPVTLTAAGRITEKIPGAALKARQMFAVERSTHCMTHF